MARRHGATQEQIDGLEDLERVDLPEGEKAALRFAEKMTIDAASIRESDVDALRQHYDDDQIVELACVVGLFNSLNRFAEAMGLWPTRPGEGGPRETETETEAGTGTEDEDQK